MTASVKTLLQQARARLAAHSPSAQLDAEVLLGHLLGASRAQLYANPERVVPADQVHEYEQLLEARSGGRPVAQLTGEREFWSLPLQVTSDVLSPRPETELLVESALQQIPEYEPCAVLDLGTGSGAIAVAIATERKQCSVTATDASNAALAVARANAARLCPGRVEFVHGSWYAPLAGLIFDVIVSNPPYIAELGGPPTDPELAFEPRQALYSGADGLDAIREIISGATAHLRPGGWLLLEHGCDQADAVCALLMQAGFTACRTVSDLAGHPRVSVGQHAGRVVRTV